MQIISGKTYLNGEGIPVRITKAKWDSGFLGYSTRNDVFMGYYSATGEAFGGEPTLANLVSEVEPGLKALDIQ